MPARQTFTVRLDLDGVPETLRALRRLGPDASDALRAASLTLSEDLAAKIRAAGQAEGRQAALLVGTVKARRDRLPSVTIGGSSPAVGRRWPGRGRAKPYELLFGSEFGGHGHGFKPHRGRQGYWINPTVERENPAINRAWNGAADRVVRTFGGSR